MGDQVTRRKAVLRQQVLTRRHGGELARTGTYCLYFQQRPHTLGSILCGGCPDQERCSQNPAPALKMVWLYLG